MQSSFGKLSSWWRKKKVKGCDEKAHTCLTQQDTAMASGTSGELCAL